MNTKQRLAVSVLLAALCAVFLCGCNSSPAPIHEGETYLDGAYYYSDGTMDIGYNLFPDGSGFMFIGEVVNPIQYGIYEGYLYISVNGGTVDPFPFEETDRGILIQSLLYETVEDDPEIAESIAQLADRAETENSEVTAAKQVGFYVAAAVACAFAIFLILWCVRTIKKRKGEL